MKRVAFSIFAVAFLTAPVLARSLVVTDKPIVVADGADINVGGVRIGVGDRDLNRYRDRDSDWRCHHRDGDRGLIVIKKKPHERGREHHNDRGHD